MGMMIDGRWMNEVDRTMQGPGFVRASDGFDCALDEETIDRVEAGRRRYVLVASKSCPWSHRVVLVRALKGLQDRVPLHVAEGPRVEGYGLRLIGPLGKVNGAVPQHLHQLYRRSDPGYTGRATVPLLWDRGEHRILSNNSARLMRSLDRLEAGFVPAPEDLRARIDGLNADLYRGLGNAVYRAGLAQAQSAYDEAVGAVFDTLDRLETRLAESRFLLGPCLTESDLMAFAALVRFDAVYATHFRCSRRRLADYPHLWGYARDLYLLPGIAATVDFEAILEGYYRNDGDHNPHAIVAERPQADWDAPHGRERFGPALVRSRNSGRMPLAEVVGAIVER